MKCEENICCFPVLNAAAGKSDFLWSFGIKKSTICFQCPQISIFMIHSNCCITPWPSPVKTSPIGKSEAWDGPTLIHSCPSQRNFLSLTVQSSRPLIGLAVESQSDGRVTAATARTRGKAPAHQERSMVRYSRWAAMPRSRPSDHAVAIRDQPPGEGGGTKHGPLWSWEHPSPCGGGGGSSGGGREPNPHHPISATRWW